MIVSPHDKNAYSLKPGQKVWALIETEDSERINHNQIIKAEFIERVEVVDDFNDSLIECYFSVKDASGEKHKADEVITTPEEAQLEEVRLLHREMGMIAEEIHRYESSIISLKKEMKKCKHTFSKFDPKMQKRVEKESREHKLFVKQLMNVLRNS